MLICISFHTCQCIATVSNDEVIYSFCHLPSSWVACFYLSLLQASLLLVVWTACQLLPEEALALSYLGFNSYFQNTKRN